MPAAPKVSVVIPTFNRGHIITEAVESVLAQTYKNVEVIVVDDGSTDNTHERLRQYGPKLTLLFQENAGPAAARNRGVLCSTGELIGFLDSDDIWSPDFVERQVSMLQRAGTTVPCTLANGWLHFSDGLRATAFEYAGLLPDLEEGIWTNPDEILATRFLQFNQMVIVRRDVLLRLGIFDSKLRYLEDWDLALRLSTCKPWGFVRQPLVNWRQSKSDSLSRVDRRNEVLLRETVVEIRMRAIARLEQHSHSSENLQYLLKHGLGHNQRELQVARLSVRGPIGSLLGNCIKKVEKVRHAIWCRSSRYPKMNTVAITDNTVSAKAWECAKI